MPNIRFIPTAALSDATDVDTDASGNLTTPLDTQNAGLAVGDYRAIVEEDLGPVITIAPPAASIEAGGVPQVTVTGSTLSVDAGAVPATTGATPDRMVAVWMTEAAYGDGSDLETKAAAQPGSSFAVTVLPDVTVDFTGMAVGSYRVLTKFRDDDPRLDGPYVASARLDVSAPTDTVAPTVGVTVNSVTTNSANISVTSDEAGTLRLEIEDTDNGDIVVQSVTQSITTAGYTGTIAGLSQGNFRAVAYVTDAANNVGSANAPFAIAAGGSGGALSLNEVVPRDRFIFDSGRARGQNAAAIPVSGTGTDGRIVQARLVVAETGLAVTPWADVVAIAGGVWFGTVSGARHPDYVRVETRLKDEIAVTATHTNRLAVGNVMAILGQSEVARMWSPDHDRLVPETLSIKNAVLALEQTWATGARLPRDQMKRPGVDALPAGVTLGAAGDMRAARQAPRPSPPRAPARRFNTVLNRPFWC